ncbi:MAG: TonB-dependent receptor [Desulfurivibrionaceae bacterium]|jgi:iron complex outermembrane receptor protein|nr:TonB-dependent receptor [Desulfurivibrionaceae bacterium]
MAGIRSFHGKKRPLSRKATTLAALSMFMAASQPCSAARANITALSLEELLAVEITSVSKKTEKAGEAAAAVFVVSQEDIKRSGATSIPEVLRMVPGLQVARIDANKWAITSRGFNAFSANKLLVLMDGRTAYNPLFSGVLWNAQDTVLEDIERIEVIRGPGASLWGANAVNGVINIITKHSADTQGTLLTAGTGSEEKGFGTARYGGKINDRTTYRVYGKNFYRDDLAFADGTKADDDWYQWRGGFRVDSGAPESPYSFTIQGDAYNGNADATTNIPATSPPYTTDISNPSNIRGGDLLTRMTRKGTDNSEMTLQAYYDLARSNDRLLGDERSTADLEFQHRFQATAKQELTWGLGYRYTRDSLENSATFSFAPASRTDMLLSAFLQDEITLVDDLLRLTLGSKFEHNDFTGYEVQPNARLLYTPHKHHTFWGAVSQAVRTPSQADHDIRISSAIAPNAALPAPISLLPPGLAEIVINGNEDFKSEKLIAYEVGYRTQIHDALAFDLTAFLNDYSRLRTTPASAHFITANNSGDPALFYQLNYEAGNTMEGNTCGFELVADAKPLDWWRLQLAYTYLRLDLQETGQGLFASEDAEGESPRNQISLRSMMNLRSGITLDTWLRYVDTLPTYGIDSYVALDARVAWQVNPQVELSLVGRNLLDNAQPEFGYLFINTIPSEIERSVYAQARMTF